jgi:hypothetical protein
MTAERAEQVALRRVERDAMSIIFSEMEGRTFDWRTMTFEPLK